jgi:hypothetical protein
LALKSFILNGVGKQHTNAVHNFVRKWTLLRSAYDEVKPRMRKRFAVDLEICRHFKDLEMHSDASNRAQQDSAGKPVRVHNSPNDTHPDRLSRPRGASTGAASRVFTQRQRPAPRNSSTGAHFARGAMHGFDERRHILGRRGRMDAVAEVEHVAGRRSRRTHDARALPGNGRRIRQ